MDLNKELSRQPSLTTSDNALSSSVSAKHKDAHFIGDELAETSLVDMVLTLLGDSNSEVKNLAVNWYVAESQLLHPKGGTLLMVALRD